MPYTRGSEVSRSVAQIVAEAERLADSGVRELTLLGQNVNAWHGEGDDGREWGLGELLFRLARIPGVARLRYTTSHPRDMDDTLITAHRDLRQLMPYLHLPVQAGSDRILKAMNRRHKADEYIRLVERIREVRPDMALSGDFIVGFPAKLIRISKIRCVWCVKCIMRRLIRSNIRRVPAHRGRSSRPCGRSSQDERLQRLQILLNEQQYAFQDSLVGREMDVLLEKKGRFDRQMVGRSPWLLPAIIDDNEDQVGEIIRVKITGTGTNSLIAQKLV